MYLFDTIVSATEPVEPACSLYPRGTTISVNDAEEEGNSSSEQIQSAMLLKPGPRLGACAEGRFHAAAASAADSLGWMTSRERAVPGHNEAGRGHRTPEGRPALGAPLSGCHSKQSCWQAPHGSWPLWRALVPSSVCALLPPSQPVARLQRQHHLHFIYRKNSERSWQHSNVSLCKEECHAA